MNETKKKIIGPFGCGFIFGSLFAVVIVSILYYKSFSIGNQTYNNLTLKDLSGRPIDLAKFEGRPIVVNYWATWCKPCIQEFPEFERVNRQYKGRVAFIMIADNSIDKVKKFVNDDTELSFFVCEEPLKLNVRPVTLFYNREHQLVAKHIGELGPRGLDAKVQSIR